MRPAHELKPLTRCVIPEHLIFVDTETTQTPLIDGKIYHELLLGVCIYHRHRRDGNKHKKDTYRFRDAQDFWDYAISKRCNKTVMYIISHNAVFDFTVLQHIHYLSEYGYTCKFVYEGGVTFISKWRGKNHTIIILDNSNWFKGKLARWGDELDLPKFKMPDTSEGIERMFLYCERDTEILYWLFLWYIKFIRDNDLGTWKYTIASNAFASYRHRFMGHRIYIPSDESEAKLARESYHGGRTECFQIGCFNDGPYYKLDINSMYPYVMRNYEYPTCFEKLVYRPRLQAVHKSLTSKGLICRTLVNATIPFFVYRHNDRNVYPVGTFETVLTTRELMIAFDLGMVIDILDCAVYRKRYIFKEYVDFFYRIKQQASENGKKLLKAFAKLYLNSLYGKFGQRGFIDKVIGENQNFNMRVSSGYNVRTGERFTLRQLGTQIIYSSKGDESYNSFCAIASHVTANARLMLYNLIIKAGRENCYYSDTDSIIVNRLGYERLKHLLDNYELGKLKVEGIANKVIIEAAKHYQFGDKTVLKGIRPSAEQITENSYKQEIWPGLNSILRTGKERYYNYWQIKTLNPTIYSGNVQSDGTIKPFEFS